MIILERILEKWGVTLWIAFNYLRIGSQNGRFLWTFRLQIRKCIFNVNATLWNSLNNLCRNRYKKISRPADMLLNIMLPSSLTYKTCPHRDSVSPSFPYCLSKSSSSIIWGFPPRKWWCITKSDFDILKQCSHIKWSVCPKITKNFFLYFWTVEDKDTMLLQNVRIWLPNDAASDHRRRESLIAQLWTPKKSHRLSSSFLYPSKVCLSLTTNLM